MTHDAENLQRFVAAQNAVYETVIRELGNGRKVTHWMWYVFPQIAGLGSSSTAQLYALRSGAEARDYLDHPLLGERLRDCTQLVLGHAGLSARDIFGEIDAMKFRSSMTLFASIANGGSCYQQAIDAFFAGMPDRKTLDILAGLA